MLRKLFGKAKAIREKAALTEAEELKALIREAVDNEGGFADDEVKVERLLDLADKAGYSTSEPGESGDGDCRNLWRTVENIREVEKLADAPGRFLAIDRAKRAADQAINTHEAETQRLLTELEASRKAELEQIKANAVTVREEWLNARQVMMRRDDLLESLTHYYGEHTRTTDAGERALRPLAVPKPGDSPELIAARLKYQTAAERYAEYASGKRVDPYDTATGVAFDAKGDAAKLVYELEAAKAGKSANHAAMA